MLIKQYIYIYICIYRGEPDLLHIYNIHTDKRFPKRKTYYIKRLLYNNDIVRDQSLIPEYDSIVEYSVTPCILLNLGITSLLHLPDIILPQGHGK